MNHLNIHPSIVKKKLSITDTRQIFAFLKTGSLQANRTMETVYEIDSHYLISVWGVHVILRALICCRLSVQFSWLIDDFM